MDNKKRIIICSLTSDPSKIPENIRNKIGKVDCVFNAIFRKPDLPVADFCDLLNKNI